MSETQQILNNQAAVEKLKQLIAEAELYPYDETDMKTVILNLRELLKTTYHSNYTEGTK